MNNANLKREALSEIKDSLEERIDVIKTLKIANSCINCKHCFADNMSYCHNYIYCNINNDMPLLVDHSKWKTLSSEEQDKRILDPNCIETKWCTDNLVLTNNICNNYQPKEKDNEQRKPEK